MRIEPGKVMGTTGYMSPEQVRGATVDHRSDIFSFGVVLYELLAGKRAFHAETSVETMRAILKEEPEDLPDTVPSGVRRIVAHCPRHNGGGANRCPRRPVESVSDRIAESISSADPGLP